MAKFKSLNIGDTVRVVSLADTDDRCGVESSMLETVGDVSEITALGRQYSTDLGRVQLANGWWYSPKGLEVVEATEPTTLAESTPELTDTDFKYTRVRAKKTGAEGVVVGRSVSGNIAVLHDKSEPHYHCGSIFAVDFVGVEGRMYYYTPSNLEVIGGVN